MAAMQEVQADLVISDMAPNMNGIADVDQPRSIHLVELALDMAREIFKPGGSFVARCSKAKASIL